MDTATRVQIPDETVCISRSTDTLCEYMNQTIPALAMDRK